MAEKKPNYISITVSDETKDSIMEISQKREWSMAYVTKRLVELAIDKFKDDLINGKHPAPIETPNA